MTTHESQVLKGIPAEVATSIGDLKLLMPHMLLNDDCSMSKTDSRLDIVSSLC